MDDNMQKIIAEQLKTLPQELRDAISAIDYASKLQTIVKNNKLMIDQGGKLETETTLVMLGLEPLADYMTNLISNVGLSHDQAVTVARDVNELIFKNIRETLRKINEAAVAAENEVVKTPGTPSKEEALSGIENPGEIKMNEQSVSMSALTSNNSKPIAPIEKINGVEIRPNMLPEINPEAMLPMKTSEPVHENISPVANIIETKMTETVAIPKETIVVEEKTKLPEKTKPGVDAYREPIN